MSAVEVKAQVQVIQEILKGVMIKDVHYGIIPGTPKPTLYKPGSEKILATFHIAADPRVIEDLSTEDEIRYRVKVYGVSYDGIDIFGVGIGECSSSEEKYKWRRPVCDEEFNEAPEDRKRAVWKRGKEKNYQQKQVRTNPADVANTILKMAKKRAQIDMTLTSTAASDVFEQDLEDMPEEIREGVTREEPKKDPPKQPQSKSAQAEGEKDLRAEITKMVNEMVEEELRNDYLLDKTAWDGKDRNTGEKKHFEGKTDLTQVSDAAIKVVYGKVKKDYEAWSKPSA